jgi:hypothetical protein
MSCRLNISIGGSSAGVELPDQQDWTTMTFDKRKDGFEKKFALDAEKRFRAEARSNRLLGLWAAEEMGMTGNAAIAYAGEVVVADLEEAGDADVVRKLLKDFKTNGLAMTEQEIRTKIQDFRIRVADEASRSD